MGVSWCTTMEANSGVPSANAAEAVQQLKVWLGTQLQEHHVPRMVDAWKYVHKRSNVRAENKCFLF